MAAARVKSIEVPVGLDTSAVEPQVRQVSATVDRLTSQEKTVTISADTSAVERKVRGAMERITNEVKRTAQNLEVALTLSGKGIDINQMPKQYATALRNQMATDDRRVVHLPQGMAYPDSAALNGGLAAAGKRRLNADLDAMNRFDLDTVGARVAGEKAGPSEKAAEKTGASVGSSVVKALASGYLFHAAMGAMSSGAEVGWAQAGMRSGSDSLGGAGAQVAQLSALKSMPIVGDVVGAFDGLLGVTRSLTMQMDSMAKLEGGRVHIAEMSGNPVMSAGLRGAERWATANREYGAAAGSNWYGGSNENSSEAFLANQRRGQVLKENAREMAVAKEQLGSELYTSGARRASAGLSMAGGSATLRGDVEGAFVAERSQAKLALEARQQAELVGKTGEQRTALVRAHFDERSAFKQETQMAWRDRVASIPEPTVMANRGEAAAAVAASALLEKAGGQGDVQDRIATTLEKILDALSKDVDKALLN